MSDEKPVGFKRKSSSVDRDSSGVICICHYDNCSETEVRELTDSQYDSLRSAVLLRQSVELCGTRLDDICSKVPLVFDSSIHGAHRSCFKKFTNVSRLQQRVNFGASTSGDKRRTSGNTVDSASTVQSRSSDRKTVTSQAGLLFPQNECLFCKKEYTYSRGSKTKELLVTCQTVCSEDTIKYYARLKNDYQLLGCIEGENLRAREARYHPSCRKAYTRARPTSSTSASVGMLAAELTDDTATSVDGTAAHAQAFDYLAAYVLQHIINDGQVENMVMLQQKYLQFMQSHYPDFYNPLYPTHRVKAKLVARFGDDLTFWQPQACCKSVLVFSSKLDVGEAVEVAFNALSSESNILRQAAGILRREILLEFETSHDMPWPPTADCLLHQKPPESVSNFISQVISGKDYDKAAERSARVSRSVAEDLCFSTSNGQWIMSKHVLLGMAMRHLTGRADVITILNRYGHCMSYPKVLELETAMALQVQLTEDDIPSNISRTSNVVSHLCWDNFDLMEETASGKGTTHSTHGIVIQEVSQHLPSDEPNIVSVPRRGVRSAQLNESFSVQSVIVPKKVEPVMSLTTVTAARPHASLCSTARSLYWMTCRALFNNNACVPDWSGWISKTTATPQQVQPSNVGYMSPIQSPITDTSVVYTCLQRSMNVSCGLSQSFTFVTFDLAAAKIALNIVWSEPRKFEGVIVHLGAFHTLCAYMAALGKYVQGSGFEEVILEAGVCASGSLQQVMNGRHYNRSLRIHHNMADAISRLMMQRFIRDSDRDSQHLSKFKELSENPSVENIAGIEEDEESRLFIQDFADYVEEVRGGKLGKTAQFWVAYCDAVWVMLVFLRAVKENNVDIYIDCLRAMCPAVFASDRLHYARYLPLYHAQLTTLDSDALQLLQLNGLSVARSHVPACRVPVDQTIEQTINRSAKSAGGVIGFSRNKKAYYRWCVTRHKRASYLDAMYAHLGMKNDSDVMHGSVRPADLRNSEREVQQLCEAIRNFHNPYDMPASANNMLVCLSSGRPANTDVETDLLQYFVKGEEAANRFVKERLVDKTVKFHDCLKKSNLKTFASNAIEKKMTSSSQKTVKVTAERNLLGRLLFLSQTNEISLQKVFRYSLSPVPWSLATADGGLVKTNKAVLMHVLEKEADATCSRNVNEDSVCVIDGVALIRCLVILPDTFGEFARQLFHSLPKAKTVHFVTDTYFESSIKGAERLKRGHSKVHLLGGPATKMPRDFSSFLAENENKNQLIQFIAAQWQSPEYAKLLHGRDVFVVCATSCVILTSHDSNTVRATSVPELQSVQEEADTRIILHCIYASAQPDFTGSIIVRSPDTDVFVLLLHYYSKISARVLFDTGSGSNRHLVDIGRVCNSIGPEVACALPAFHAFTGCDTVSAFMTKGKKRPLQLMRTSEQHLQTFQMIGQSADTLSGTLLQRLEKFVCSMYGFRKLADTGSVRYQLFQSRYGAVASQPFATKRTTGIDLALLPPSADCLKFQCMRANYQAFIWTHAHVANPDLPSPANCGWKICDSGELAIQWNSTEILPQRLIDLLQEDLSQEQFDTDDDEDLQMVEEDDVVDNIINCIFENDRDNEAD